MTKVDIKKNQKLQSLLDSSFHLFLEQGFHQTSVSDIVNRAGVAKGTFYLYFKDKEDLLTRLTILKAQQVFATAYEHLQLRGLSSFEDEIIFLVGDVLDQLSANHRLLLLISKNFSWGLLRSTFVAPSGEEPNPYEEMIKKATSQYREPQMVLYLVLDLVSSSSYNVILNEDPYTLETLRPHLYEAIRGILRQFQI